MEGEVVGNRYELEELLGSGGMSNVYRARDRQLERLVALKILHEHYGSDGDYVERFRREARAAAQLSHPNIVTVIDRGEADGRQFIVFEYVDGQTLKHLVEVTGALPVRRALELAIEVAHGLAFAHRHGLVHRDVKPQNVLLNGDGQAKVTDFGIARSLHVEQSMTQSGTVLGTSYYIAPEQARGLRVDAQTDVYSLGVVLYELLAGDVPFHGDSFVAVAMQHVHEPPPSLLERRPDVPVRVADAVDRALEKDPADRFPSMAAFAAELEACLAELPRAAGEAPTLVTRRPPAPVSAPMPPPSEPPRRDRRARRRLPWLLVALGVLLLGAAIAGVLLAGGGGAPNGTTTTGTSAAGGGLVRLTGVGTFDPPPGDGHEHDEDVARATDGDEATFWTTEHYRTFSKPGVGLVLSAPSAVALKQVTIVSDTPGFTAEIQAGDSQSGPFTTVSASQTMGSRTTFSVSTEPARFYVIWITNPGSAGVAHVNEVTAGT